MKLIMLKGLPASGKTTYAKELAQSGYTRVNKDDLRAMLHDGHWTKDNEKQVLRLRDMIVGDALTAGKSVVVDDTNLAPKHAETLKQLASKHKAVFEAKFFDVPVQECIKRDLKRVDSVGEKVIRDMHAHFLAPQPEVYTPPKDKPLAIVVDIDGTLAHMNGRGPYDTDKYHTDTLDEVIRDLVCEYHDEQSGHERLVILCSGRDDTFRAVTEQWLEKHGIPFDLLLMRPIAKEPDLNKKRKDWVVKRELFDDHIRDNYQIEFVLDDRDQVVKMWRSLGLKVLQVAEGDF